MPVRKKSINQTKKNAVKPAHSLGYGKNKELYWILSVMAILLIVLLFASSIFKSFNTFKYHGLVFTKERFGQIPVFHHYYYFYFDVFYRSICRLSASSKPVKFNSCNTYRRISFFNCLFSIFPQKFNKRCTCYN